ncbi:TPA: hypothetical protein ACVOZA_000010 [Vibrio alginolyticus]
MKDVAHEYVKQCISSELKRFEMFDTKASRFLNFVSVMLGVVIAVVSKQFDYLFPVEHFLQSVIVFLLFALAFQLCESWFHLFRALKIIEVPSLELGMTSHEFLCGEEDDIESCIIEVYAKLITKHREAVEDKNCRLDKAYKCIFRSGVLLIPTLFLIFINNL